jgi:BirA family transcriptional regulator, biotin operon repressor / biotin---[acetyl-CoA-carboxylase] ligase
MRLGWKIIKVGEVQSTNKTAQDMLKNTTAGHGMVICADYQRNGKGQYGSTWESPKGENLLCSLIITHEDYPVGRHFDISKAITIALCNYVRRYVGNTYIKWPNDIICNGRKICGVLIENTILGMYVQSSVIGIGLNVNQKAFDPAFHATSLACETDKTCDVSEVLDGVMSKADETYRLLVLGNTASIESEYLSMLYGLGEWLDFSDSLGEFRGRVKGIAPLGELLVEKPDGTIVPYGFKTIRFTMPLH